MKKSRYIFITLVISVITFIGPWPVDRTPFEDTEYAKQTFNTIDKLSFSKNKSAIRAGYAKRDITPQIGGPIGGYSARDPKKNTGAYESVFVKAITIQNSESRVTIVSSETLLPLPELVSAVTEKIGSPRNNIFFSSTHTHSGPGGYSKSFIAQQSLGNFSPDYFNFLVKKYTEAIIESQKKLTLAKLNYSNVNLNTELTQKLLLNQLEPQTPAHNTLQVLRIEEKNSNKMIASIVTLSAHPTFLGRKNKKISGDYPAPLMKKIEAEYGGGSLFLPGAVGGTLPQINGGNTSSTPDISNKQRLEYSEALFGVIKSIFSSKQDIGHIQNSELKSIEINAFLLPITLPSPNFRISDSLRLSPILVKRLFHESKSYIHVLQLGKIILFSYPADYSGELAKDLEEYAHKKGFFAWASSFNGDYIGYLTPSTQYALKHHITRNMNIYGPFGGDYSIEVSKKIIGQIQVEP